MEVSEETITAFGEIAFRNDQLQVALATTVAAVAHSEQRDMAGRPYVEHCWRVANAVAHHGTAYFCVGMLHDVVEDTSTTLVELEGMGFSPEVIAGVDAMTQRKGEDLETYWGRVKANKIAKIVKLEGDIPDNNDPERKKYLDEAFQQMLSNKYARAIAFLSDDDSGTPSP